MAGAVVGGAVVGAAVVVAGAVVVGAAVLEVADDGSVPDPFGVAAGAGDVDGPGMIGTCTWVGCSGAPGWDTRA